MNRKYSEMREGNISINSLTGEYIPSSVLGTEHNIGMDLKKKNKWQCENFNIFSSG